MYNKCEASSVKRQEGQSLLEVVIVIAVGIIVVSALVFATISSLRNAQFAKNQSIATKYAQEGIEALKGIRDRNEGCITRGSAEICHVSFDNGHKVAKKFSELYKIKLSEACANGPCYFKLSGSGGSERDSLVSGTQREWEDINSQAGTNTSAFQRQVWIKDGENNDEKVVTVVVKWVDFSGSHQSQLSTILRKYEEKR